MGTPPPDFGTLHYRDGRLTWEQLPLDALVEIGTPTYVYSEAALQERAGAFLRATAELGGKSHLCYAVKANGHPAIIAIFGQLGLGADVTSGGELFLARQAGIPAGQIIYSGVGKSRAELHLAIREGIRAIHVESEAEFATVAAIAQEEQRRQPVAVRVNPNVATGTHPYISTGGKQHKFGVSSDLAASLLQQAAASDWLAPAGLAIHIGSQITTLRPFVEAVELLIQLAQALRAQGIPVAYLDVGGGLGIDYVEAAPSPRQWVQAVAGPVVAAGFEVALEPGRSLVGAAGLLLTQVLYCKQQGEKRFVIVDAAMNDLLRPTLYGAHHPILPLREIARAASQVVDVVGPVCESGDFLARERSLPAVEAGDLLALTHAGAYGFAMSSNYNGRLRPAEVLISGASYRLIRRRQAFADLLPAT